MSIYCCTCAQGGYLTFFTCPRLGTATAERLRIMPEGELIIRGFTGATSIAAGVLNSSGATGVDSALYVKNGQIVFAYSSSGTVHYITAPITGTAGTVTWTDSTTAP